MSWTPFELIPGWNEAHNRRQRQREFNEHQRQFEVNRAFQERQFETAMQTRVQDLEAAGLHRSLAAGSPGASAPMATSGGSPKSAPVPRAQTIMEQASMAAQLRNMTAQAKLIEAQAANTRADTAFKNQHLQNEAELHPHRVGLTEQQYFETMERATQLGYKNMLEQWRAEWYSQLTHSEMRLATVSAADMLHRYNYLREHGGTPPTRNQIAAEVDQLLKDMGEPTSETARVVYLVARVLSRFLGR